jgi:hypothetical protein
MVTKTQKEVATRWLRDVPRDKVFLFHDGRTAKNLAELAAALSEIPEETFRHHVTEDKNDFSNWLRDVIGDVPLANQLKRVTTQTTTTRKVEARLDWLRARP